MFLCLREHTLPASVHSSPPAYQNSRMKKGRWNACAGTEHMNADKVGQESTTGMLCSLPKACFCVCPRYCVVVAVRSPSASTVKVNRFGVCMSDSVIENDTARYKDQCRG